MERAKSWLSEKDRISKYEKRQFCKFMHLWVNLGTVIIFETLFLFKLSSQHLYTIAFYALIQWH